MSVTSASATLTFTVASLYDSGFDVSEFSTDRMWSSEAVPLGETMMSVDGHLTGAFQYNPTKMTFTLQADSTGREFFKEVAAAMRASKEVYWIYGTLTIPGTGEVITMSKGLLDTYKPVPDGQKALQPIDYSITFESVVATDL